MHAICSTSLSAVDSCTVFNYLRSTSATASHVAYDETVVCWLCVVGQQSATGKTEGSRFFTLRSQRLDG